MSTYFNDLNYSLGNEDTGFEVSLIKKLAPKNILSVAGCGSRSLPLLHPDIDKLICVDMAKVQLLITELREATIRHFDYQNFLIFWGFPPFGAYDYSQKRQDLFYSLSLSDDCKNYFRELFGKIHWDTVLYQGKWEKTFAVLSKMLRLLLGKNFDQIFNYHDISQQMKYYSNDFPMRKWRFIIFLLGNKSVFNALLYKGHFIKKNVPESHFEYYYHAFERLFTHNLARNSFFLHLCFYGKINHEDGNTIEAQRDVFDTMKKSLLNGLKVIYENDDLITVAKKYQNLDFLSLSDVPSYFEGNIEKNFLQDLRGSLASGAHVVLRYYLRKAQAYEDGFTDVTTKFSSEIATEKVQMYSIKVLQYTP